MRREDITSLVVYLILIAGAIILGTTVIEQTFSKCYDYNFLNPYVFTLLTILVALVLNVIGLELMHVLGAKIGGYKVVSINVLGFCYEKIHNKWKFSFRDFNGLTGETKLVPDKKDCKIKPFIWAPILAWILEVAVGVVVLMLNSGDNGKKGILGIGALLFIVISSMLALYNITPLKLDTMTDGYRFVLISKEKNVEAMNELMRIEDLYRNGENVEEVKQFEVINDLTATVNLEAVYNLISKNEFNKANKIIDASISKKDIIDEYTYNRFMAQKLYILCLGEDIKEARAFYKESFKDKIRRFIANDVCAESIRAYLLIAGLIEESESEVVLLNKKITRRLEKYSETRRREESRLSKEATDKIYLTYPNWKKENVA